MELLDAVCRNEVAEVKKLLAQGQSATETMDVRILSFLSIDEINEGLF